MFFHLAVSLHKAKVTDEVKWEKRNKKANRKTCRKCYVIHFIALITYGQERKEVVCLRDRGCTALNMLCFIIFPCHSGIYASNHFGIDNVKSDAVKRENQVDNLNIHVSNHHEIC